MVIDDHVTTNSRYQKIMQPALSNGLTALHGLPLTSEPIDLIADRAGCGLQGGRNRKPLRSA
jgi:hypothetical protein